MNLKKMFIICCQISLVQKFQTRIIFVLDLVCVCICDSWGRCVRSPLFLQEHHYYLFWLQFLREQLSYLLHLQAWRWSAAPGCAGSISASLEASGGWEKCKELSSEGCLCVKSSSLLMAVLWVILFTFQLEYLLPLYRQNPSIYMI